MKNKRSLLALFLLAVLVFNFAACRITTNTNSLLCPNCSTPYASGEEKCTECGNVFVEGPTDDSDNNTNNDSDNESNGGENNNGGDDNGEQSPAIDPANYNNLLIIESIENESAAIVGMLDTSYRTTVVNAKDPQKTPKTAEELCEFGAVILCNIANDDMPEGFVDLLHTYVYDIGGGLFTVCGNKFDTDPNDNVWETNAYTRADMYGTLYQSLLPVDIVEYTPPIAVAIIIDCSGSMYAQDDQATSKLYYAKKAAEAALDALTERDYVGVIAMSDSSIDEAELLPRTDRDGIITQINAIEPGGNTYFAPAIMAAGNALSSISGVASRHVIIITDGEAGDVDWTRAALKENAVRGITTSIVGIQCNASSAEQMSHLLTQYAGMKTENFLNVNDPSNLASILSNSLRAPEFKNLNYETFRPAFGTQSDITAGITEDQLPTLDGFYGVKAKHDAEVIIKGVYNNPIYAQWQYGKGRVGTFACDLNGTWSNEFINSDVGITLLRNMIAALCPSDNSNTEQTESET